MFKCWRKYIYMSCLINLCCFPREDCDILTHQQEYVYYYEKDWIII